MCYDSINEIILDGRLYKYCYSERNVERAHFDATDKLPIPKGAKDLYTADRGYPSKAMFANMIDAGQFFSYVLQAQIQSRFRHGWKKEIISSEYTDKTYKICVFRISLNSRESEFLVINLHGKHLKRKGVGELFFKR